MFVRVCVFNMTQGVCVDTAVLYKLYIFKDFSFFFLYELLFLCIYKLCSVL